MYPHPASYSDLSGVQQLTLAVLGDTQRTLFVERLLLREQNDAQRPMVMRAIANTRPDALVHLGDAVGHGASKGKWAYFDRLMAPIREAGTPLLPVRGNHDYFGRQVVCRRHTCARFAWLEQCPWYARRFGPLLLLFLDTNKDRLTRKEWEGQHHWYAEQLAEAESDPAIRGVLTFCHHPPFTNSRINRDATHVQRELVPALVGSPKALAMFSGHAHTYERFVEQGRTFVVSGGGGGARVGLLAGALRRHADHYKGPSPRPLHFLLLRVSESNVQVEAHGLEEGAEKTRLLERFRLEFGSRT